MDDSRSDTELREGAGTLQAGVARPRRAHGLQAVLNWVGRDMHYGTLEFVAPDGRRWTLGHGEPHAVVRLHDPSALRRIALQPRLALGETYMDGAWEPESGDLLPMLEVCLRTLRHTENTGIKRYFRIVWGLLCELNTAWSSRRNVSHHYDRNPELYARFLDRDLHYSCAYFSEPGMDLEAAQQAKCALIARKLDLKPGARILDIGCGFGSLALYLAQHHDVHVTGITLSAPQQKMAQGRAKESGLENRAEFRLEDYRQTRGQYDAIVSVGMFEHVGRPHYRNFFRRIHDLLKPDGTALLHTIGNSGRPAGTNPWIRKYIFPGGYIPAASEMIAPLEASGLILTDFEVWREHYASTLAAWYEHFKASRQDIREQLGERFCRMWEFYLRTCEAAFRWGGLVVFHAQMARAPTRLPVTRDYLYR